jgi:hypothetical protein
MRLIPDTDGIVDHNDFVNIGVHSHHAQPIAITIDNTSQAINAGTNWDMDLALPAFNYSVARIMLVGAKTQGGGLWKEFAEIYATRDSDEAMGHSIRDVSLKQVYAATYSKQNADLYLSHKIFDSNTGISNRYINVRDAWIFADVANDVVRIRFHNPTVTNATLWVKGQVLAY